jgi:hypothetical protein
MIEQKKEKPAWCCAGTKTTRVGCLLKKKSFQFLPEEGGRFNVL